MFPAVRNPRLARPLLSILLFSGLSASAQVIEFWSNGLRYQTLTRDGMTVMFAPMPLSVGRYAVLQVAMNNGSDEIWRVKPTDFFFHPEKGPPIRAASEFEVIDDLFRNAGRSEVEKLQGAYERALYGNQHIRSNNGYEQRRISALSLGDKGVKAAAAASAVAFATTEMGASDATDGAVFFPTGGRPLGPGRVTAVIHGRAFEFRPISAGSP